MDKVRQNPVKFQMQSVGLNFIIFNKVFNQSVTLQRPQWPFPTLGSRAPSVLPGWEEEAVYRAAIQGCPVWRPLPAAASFLEAEGGGLHGLGKN